MIPSHTEVEGANEVELGSGAGAVAMSRVVGAAVGGALIVGRKVGAAEGDMDAVVGALVGVKLIVGRYVGAAVGRLVGTAVGALVGAAVGAAVYGPSAQWMFCETMGTDVEPTQASSEVNKIIMIFRASSPPSTAKLRFA